MFEANELHETADLIHFISQLEYNQLPLEVVHKTKQCLMDTVGCAFTGLKTTAHGQIVTELVREMGGKPESTVWGERLRTNAVNAAMANGTNSHGLDLDDAHREAFLHVGVGTIPAVLAEAERVMAGGKKVITATVAAFEVAIRIALAVNPALRLRGFHTTGTVGTFGAAMGAGKILGLSQEQLINALGMAGTQAAGLWQFNDDGDMSKRFHPGKAAANGILAARLAQKGMTGPYRVLEGRFGFPAAFVGEYNPKMIHEDLGNNFQIMGVGLKIHASCRYTNTPIDAALVLAEKYNLRPSDVVKGTIHSCQIAADQLKKKDVQTLLDAQISGPFCVALAIARRRAGHREFLDNLEDPEIINLTQKIDMAYEPAFGVKDRNAVVEIITSDGRTLRQEAELAKGEPENPISQDELEAKFKDQALCILKEYQAENLIESFRHLEILADLSQMMTSMCPDDSN